MASNLVRVAGVITVAMALVGLVAGLFMASNIMFWVYNMELMDIFGVMSSTPQLGSSTTQGILMLLAAGVFLALGIAMVLGKTWAPLLALIIYVPCTYQLVASEGNLMALFFRGFHILTLGYCWRNPLE